MNAGRSIVAVVIVGLVLSGTVYADMAASDYLNATETVWLRARPDPGRPPAADPSVDSAVVISPIVRRQLPSAEAPEAVHDSLDVHILTERQDSLHLCVWALLGLGLCKSAPWVKRLSIGVIPEWYHDGGPFQIGHSSAISPDCLSSTPVHCFIQPEGRDQAPLPQYPQRWIISLWRESQFSPLSIASRGPPCLAC